MDKVRNLGVIFDSDLSFSQHISSAIKSCYCKIRDYARIRPLLSRSDAISLTNALVGSRLDYCNSLLSGITNKEIKRLQRIQNILCRITSKPRYNASTTASLKSLHWLPVRVRFKINTMTYKALHTGQPVYFSLHLNPYTCTHKTRRSNPDMKYLQVPALNTKLFKNKNLADKSFQSCASISWNLLPLSVRSAESLGSF